MKLLACTHCHDLLALRSAKRSCICKRSSGYYVDENVVRVQGPCIVLGLDGADFKRLLNNEGTRCEHTGLNRWFCRTCNEIVGPKRSEDVVRFLPRGAIFRFPSDYPRIRRK